MLQSHKGLKQIVELCSKALAVRVLLNVPLSDQTHSTVALKGIDLIV